MYSRLIRIVAVLQTPNRMFRILYLLESIMHRFEECNLIFSTHHYSWEDLAINVDYCLVMCIQSFMQEVCTNRMARV